MIYRLAGFVSLCNLIICTPALSESRPHGDSNSDKALVYLIQPEGTRRHLFSGKEWLGVVNEDAYTFTHLAPGEHFIWVDGGRIFGAVFFAAGSTNYVEIGAKDITALSPEKGESMLAHAGSYSEPTDGDRAAEEEKQSRTERLQRIKKRRLAVINSKYGDLGVTVKPLLRQPKLEQPRRKKPEDDGSSWDNGLAYSLPPEIALGVIALGVVINAIEKAVDSRLSDSEKQLINESTGSLTQLLSGESVARDLQRHIVDSGRLAGKESVFADMDDQRGEHGVDGPVAIDPLTISTVVEVETSGIGLVPAEKRYRPSRFVMASRIRVLNGDDGTVLKDRSLCYASSDSPDFSAWAVDQNKRLRAELDTAYTATAETLLLILAGEAYSNSSENNQLCDTLTEIVERRLATPNEPER